MLDIKTIREKTDWVCARLAARNAGDESKVREIFEGNRDAHGEKTPGGSKC